MYTNNYNLGVHHWFPRCKCGARTKEKVRLLKAPCQGRPGSDTKFRELSRLKDGLAPSQKTRAHGRPTPYETVFAEGGVPFPVGDSREDPAGDELTQALATVGLVCERPSGSLPGSSTDFGPFPLVG